MSDPELIRGTVVGELVELRIPDVEAMTTQMRALVDGMGFDMAVLQMAKNLFVTRSDEALAGYLAIALAKLAEKES